MMMVMIRMMRIKRMRMVIRISDDILPRKTKGTEIPNHRQSTASMLKIGTAPVDLDR